MIKLICMKKINPFLWFDSEAEQAAKFYVGIFKNSRIGKIARYPKEAAEKIGRMPGSVVTVEFTLDRVEFAALNGGPTGRCGWLKNKFGLSWQINPVFLGDMLTDPDAGKANRVMKAMMEMDKIDIAALQKAAQG